MMIFGRWVNGVKQRCDFCHRIPIKSRAYMVKEGSAQGIFCGEAHARLAMKAVEENELPEHEKHD